MKKVTLILAVIASSFAMTAQTSLTNAVDFTVTDLDGNSHTLFDYLYDGKYVCLDFFAFWCGPCAGTAPDGSIVEQDIWPMDASILDGVLQGYGLDYLDCTNSVEEAVAEFSVYPVAASDFVNVQLEEVGASIEVINIIGATVVSTVATETNTRLDVSALEAGSYLVRVTSNGEVRTKAIQVIK